MPSAMISLPIDSYIATVLQAFEKKLSVILTAPPGSGKTLRVPVALAKKLIEKNSGKKIIVLVPKRIAAVSAANRIAEENDWRIGEEVGYQVRFDQKFSSQTKLIFMTEGVFVKRMNSAEFLNQIETIVFDEFHERSSLNDIAFGFCYERQVLSESAQPLKILVMSATLETEKLESYLQNAETIHVELKPFPLRIVHSKKSQRLQFDLTLLDQIAEVTKEAYRHQQKDILIFLPGLYEIRQVQNKLSHSLSGVSIEILHGSIPLQEQRKILAPADHRRLILSTNVAESSLTLPSVDCVIDTGLEKRAVFERKIGFQRLELKRISLFSARQRAGRAARVGPGVCYQLWHLSDERSMGEQIEPEIMKSSLLEETLILASVGVTDPQTFSWLDRPAQSFQNVLLKFKRWNLIDDKNQITTLGRDVQKCPLDIERGLLFIELSLQGHQREAARFLAFLETTDFSKQNSLVELSDLHLTDLGQKIQNQLLQFDFSARANPTPDPFRTTLIKIYLKFFPEKMAQRKETVFGISSLGRGVQFAPYLVSKESDYFLLLNGRDISDSTTAIDYSVSFSQEEFEFLSQEEQRIETEFIVDFEKMMVYKQQKRLSGLFTISTGTKTPLDEKKDAALFNEVFKTNVNDFIKNHPQAESFFKKINFLRRKSSALEYAEQDFEFLNQINDKVYESLEASVTSLSEFMRFDLYSLLAYLAPSKISSDLQKLPSVYTLSSGKTVPIDYVSELAPQISVRLQELLGVIKTPTLLDERLKVTVELLAPNYRPAQITGDLESFWKTSYQDVRKDLRARYPKHDWPENPLDWKPEMSKRFKK